MGVKNLRQTVTLRASPHEVYEALMDPKEHAKFTGAPAKMDRKPGGRFRHYGNDLTGFVLDFERDRTIVLAWRSSGWSPRHYSIARFSLTPSGGGTKLVFEQFGIPDGDFEDIRDGWKQYYWVPLKEYLEG